MKALSFENTILHYMKIWFISQILLLDSYVQSTLSSSKLLVIFIDGFRWDYVSNLSVPTKLINFRRLYLNGASVEKVMPVFPTDCYPNIYSIFTGKQPSQHGVLFNEIYNSTSGDSFFHEDETTRHKASQWVHAATLWQQLASEGRGSYLHHLPTCTDKNVSSVEIECVEYDKSAMTVEGFRHGLQMAFSRLTEDQADLAVVYHDSIDQLAHEYGPLSPEILHKRLPELDAAIGSVLDEIDQVLGRNLNLVLVSDHGLAESAQNGHIIIDRFLRDSSTERISNRGTTLSIWINALKTEQVYSLMKSSSKASAKFQIYTKDTLPRERRLDGPFAELFPSIYLIAKPGYVFLSDIAKDRGPSSDEFGRNETLKRRRGWHGYEPEHLEMQTPLMVYGPRAKAGVRLVQEAVFTSASVYQVLANLLQTSDSQSHDRLSLLVLEEPDESLFSQAMLSFTGDRSSCFIKFAGAWALLCITGIVLVLLIIVLCKLIKEIPCCRRGGKAHLGRYNSCSPLIGEKF